MYIARNLISDKVMPLEEIFNLKFQKRNNQETKWELSKKRDKMRDILQIHGIWSIIESWDESKSSINYSLALNSWACIAYIPLLQKFLKRYNKCALLFCHFTKPLLKVSDSNIMCAFDKFEITCESNNTTFLSTPPPSTTLEKRRQYINF